jgi:DNA-binding response OmpR family regulator
MVTSDGDERKELPQEETYDHILCCLMLSKMHEFKVPETLKENIKIPIIVLTNSSQGDDEKEFKLLG